MRGKIVILDTSIMCCWLNVYKKDTCGPDNDKWDKARVDEFINNKIKEGATLVLPLPVIIETGNHIAQASSMRYECAVEFIEFIKKAVDEESPWAAFSRQSYLWDGKKIKDLLAVWPELIRHDKKGNLSMGDIMIKAVADFYSSFDNEVIILTGDQGLKTYANVDISNIPIPRRRK